MLYAGIFTKAFTNPIKWHAALDLIGITHMYIAVSGLQLAPPRHHVGGLHQTQSTPSDSYKTIVVDEDEDNGASEQLLVLCEYMVKEYLNQELSEINKAFATHVGKERDLYDMVIWTINSEPVIAECMKNMRKFKKMGT